MKVFLGGTTNESTWRNRLIAWLDIDFFNPVVDDWTPECIEEENRQKKICDYCLYVITPLMTGLYSIAEVVDDSNKRPEKTLFCTLRFDGDKEFDEGQRRSLYHIRNVVTGNGGKYFDSLKGIADFLNEQGKEK